jgi:hypothetical protein
VITGTQWGPVDVTAQLLDQAPSGLEPGWDMIAERDVTTQTGLVMLSAPFAGGQRRLESRLGRHRARIHVRNRVAAFPHNILEGPIESHLLQIWPSDVPQPVRALTDVDEFIRTHYPH